MQMTTDMNRRAMGCGYEPPLRFRLPLWTPDAFPDKSPDICAGYLVRLPEVLEVARAYNHWSKGELASFTLGPPHEQLSIGLEILAGSINELECARMKPASLGGLGHG